MVAIDARIIFPIVSILAVGSLEVDIIKKRILRIKESETILEYLLESLILGSISLIILMLIIARIADVFDFATILERFVYVYFSIGLAYLVFKIYKWVRKKLPIYALSDKKRVTGSLSILLIVIILLMLFFYILQGLVYPLRGWDFLHFYLPNSFRIYVTGQLGIVNELNFLPQFKPPANVLLYAYTFFVTQAEMLHLVPMLFLTGTVFLCYKIAITEGLSEKVALFGSIAFLATPLVFFLVYEFQYYQEIYIMFFTAASFYFFRQFLKKNTTKERMYTALLTSLSLTGCILSKISGFIIPLVILVAVPSDKIGKILRAIIIIGFTIQLFRKSLFDIFVGTSIFLLLIAGYCVYLVITSKSLPISYTRWLYIAAIYSIPLAMGIYWGVFILSIPGVKEYFLSLYINPTYQNVSLKWPGIDLPETETYLENAHHATFISSSFSIFIATMFAGTWIIFKIIGVIKTNKENKEILLWLFFFFLLWQGLFAHGSIRYLTPILIPISLVFMVGIDSTIKFLNKRDGLERDGFFTTVFIIASAYLSLYPIMPFEITNEDFHLRWYHAHTHFGSLLGYILLFNLVFFLLLWKEKKLKLSFSMIYNKKFNFRKILAGFFIFILFFVPFGAQAALLIHVKFDINKFHTDYCYYTRASLLELIDAINRLGYDDNQTVLTINTPGLEYYASQPVFDMFMLGFITRTAFSNSTFTLSKKNITRVIEFFQSYNVAIFVSLNTSNDWYPAYLERYYWNYDIYRLIHNNLLFTWRFSNEEYMMFTINSYDSYIGPVDIQISGNESKESLLAQNPNSAEIHGNYANLDAVLDLTAVPTNELVNISLSTAYTFYENSSTVLIAKEISLEKPMNEEFTRLSLLSLPDESIGVNSLNITITYENYEGYVEEISYKLKAFMKESVVIQRITNYWSYSGYYGFVYL
ncbi:MAG: hypothetical protein ACFFDS_05230 [Candidatus Thorarchaeota archaeon]